MRRLLVLSVVALLALAAPAAADTVAVSYTDSLLLPSQPIPKQVAGLLTVGPSGRTVQLAEPVELRPDSNSLDIGPQPVFPAWSPDGRQVAYAVDGLYKAAPFEKIVVVGADGAGRRELDTGTSHVWGLTWSPDGRQIAFIATTHTPDDFYFNGDVVVMNADGSDMHTVTTGGYVQEVHWSARGDIVYRRLVPTLCCTAVSDPGSGIWLLSHGATAARKLLPDGWFVADWSPDGRRMLAYHYNEKKKTYLYYSLDANGKHRRPLSAKVPITVVAHWVRADQLGWVERDFVGESYAVTVDLAGKHKRRLHLPSPALDARRYTGIAWRP